MIDTSTHHPGLALGGVFLALFGGTWLAGASYQYAGPSVPLLAAVVLLSLLLAGWAVRTFRARRRACPVPTDQAARQRVRRGLIAVNAVQWTSIAVAIVLLNATGHAGWIMPCVVFVVGIHFFPLGRLFRYRGYYVTAAALVLVALLYMAAGASPRGAALTLFATGAILWASAVALLRAV